jgi:hypothetical protein
MDACDAKGRPAPGMQSAPCKEHLDDRSRHDASYNGPSLAKLAVTGHLGDAPGLLALAPSRGSAPRFKGLTCRVRQCSAVTPDRSGHAQDRISPAPYQRSGQRRFTTSTVTVVTAAVANAATTNAQLPAATAARRISAGTPRWTSSRIGGASLRTSDSSARNAHASTGENQDAARIPNPIRICSLTLGLCIRRRRFWAAPAFGNVPRAFPSAP